MPKGAASEIEQEESKDAVAGDNVRLEYDEEWLAILVTTLSYMPLLRKKYARFDSVFSS